MWNIAANEDRLYSVEKTKAESDVQLSLRGEFDPDRSSDAPFVRHAISCSIDAAHRAPAIDLVLVPPEMTVGLS